MVCRDHRETGGARSRGSKKRRRRKKKWRTRRDSMNARRKRNGVSFSREIASQISRENYPIVCRGRPPPRPLPVAATSYFIPRLHNRLFVSRFYPRCGSQPPPARVGARGATFLPPRRGGTSAGRRTRGGDGEKVPQGYRKPPSRRGLASSTLPAALDLLLSTSSWFARRPPPSKTARPKSTGNELGLRPERQLRPLSPGVLTLNPHQKRVIFIL